MVLGKHKPLISHKTHKQIQHRLNGGDASYKNREGAIEDFPLRGYLVCPECGNNMTASNTVKKGKKHPYYRCKSSPKICTYGGKSIKKADLEAQFEEEILPKLKPSEQVTELTKAILQRKHQQKLDNLSREQTYKRQELAKIDNNIKSLVDKLTTTKLYNVQKVVEEKIDKMVQTKEKIEQEIKAVDKVDINIGTSQKLVNDFMQGIDISWKKGNFNKKQSILRIILASKIPYTKKTGFGTISKRLPFCVTEDNDNDEGRMVGAEGFEPPTKAL